MGKADNESINAVKERKGAWVQGVGGEEDCSIKRESPRASLRRSDLSQDLKLGDGVSHAGIWEYKSFRQQE